MTNKPQMVEIPENANDQIVRIQLDEIAKTVKQSPLGNKSRITVRIQKKE
jgi:hypothetical protein